MKINVFGLVIAPVLFSQVEAPAFGKSDEASCVRVYEIISEDLLKPNWGMAPVTDLVAATHLAKELNARGDRSEALLVANGLRASGSGLKKLFAIVDSVRPGQVLLDVREFRRAAQAVGLMDIDPSHLPSSRTAAELNQVLDEYSKAKVLEYTETRASLGDDKDPKIPMAKRLTEMSDNPLTISPKDLEQFVELAAQYRRLQDTSQILRLAMQEAAIDRRNFDYLTQHKDEIRRALAKKPEDQNVFVILPSIDPRTGLAIQDIRYIRDTGILTSFIDFYKKRVEKAGHLDERLTEHAIQWMQVRRLRDLVIAPSLNQLGGAEALKQVDPALEKLEEHRREAKSWFGEDKLEHPSPRYARAARVYMNSVNRQVLLRDFWTKKLIAKMGLFLPFWGAYSVVKYLSGVVVSEREQSLDDAHILDGNYWIVKCRGKSVPVEVEACLDRYALMLSVYLQSHPGKGDFQEIYQPVMLAVQGTTSKATFDYQNASLARYYLKQDVFNLDWKQKQMSKSKTKAEPVAVDGEAKAQVKVSPEQIFEGQKTALSDAREVAKKSWERIDKIFSEPGEVKMEEFYKVTTEIRDYQNYLHQLLGSVMQAAEINENSALKSKYSSLVAQIEAEQKKVDARFTSVLGNAGSKPIAPIPAVPGK